MILFSIVNVFFAALALLTAMKFHSFYASPQISLRDYVPEVEVNLDPSNEADLPLSPDQLLDMNRMDKFVEDLPLSPDHFLDTNWVDSITDEPLDNYAENYAFPVFSITFLAGVLLLFGVLFWKHMKTFWQQKSAMDAELQELRNKIKENQDMVTEHSLLEDKVSQLQKEKRSHEIQLLEKEKELKELRSKLQETQRLLDAKMKESETKVVETETEEGRATEQNPVEEADKTHEAKSPIELFHNTDQDKYVIFKGEEIYCEPTGLKTNLTAKVEIDKSSLPLIVGKSGFVVSNIEYFTRTEIHMPAQYEMRSMVSVTGDKDDIQCALDMIEAILINNIVYKRGDKKHANDTPTANSPGVGTDEINLDASISFKGNVLYGYPTGQPELLKVDIELPNNQRRALVGYKGRNISCVENVSKVEILLPRFHENSNVVSVTGRKSNILMALRMMEYLLRKFGY